MPGVSGAVPQRSASSVHASLSIRSRGPQHIFCPQQSPPAAARWSRLVAQERCCRRCSSQSGHQPDILLDKAAWLVLETIVNKSGRRATIRVLSDRSFLLVDSNRTTAEQLGMVRRRGNGQPRYPRPAGGVHDEATPTTAT